MRTVVFLPVFTGFYRFSTVPAKTVFFCHNESPALFLNLQMCNHVTCHFQLQYDGDCKAWQII